MPALAIDPYGRFVTSAQSPSDPFAIPGFNGYGPPPDYAPPGYAQPPGYPYGAQPHYAAQPHPGPPPNVYRGPVPAQPHPQWRYPDYDVQNYDPRDRGHVPPPFNPRAYRNPDTGYFMQNAQRYMGPGVNGFDNYGYNPYVRNEYDYAPLRAMYRGQDPFRGPMHAGYHYPEVAPGVPAYASMAHPPAFPQSPPFPQSNGIAIDPHTGVLTIGAPPAYQPSYQPTYAQPAYQPHYSQPAYPQQPQPQIPPGFQAVQPSDGVWTETEIAPGVLLKVRKGVQVAWKQVAGGDQPVAYVTSGFAPDVTLAALLAQQEQAGFFPLVIPAIRLATNENAREHIRDAGSWIRDRAEDVRDRFTPAPAPRQPAMLPDYGPPMQGHPREYDYASGAFASVEALLVDSDGYRRTV